MIEELAIVGGVCGSITALIVLLKYIYSFFYGIDELKTRFNDVEKKVNESCLELDEEKVLESLRDVNKKLERDFAELNEMRARQVVLINSVVNLFTHVIEGNNVDKLHRSYDDMIKELLKIDCERGGE